MADKKRIFGVYQKAQGSYTVCDVRFTPLEAVACDATAKDVCCVETSPVAFFETKEAADKAIVALKAAFAAKPKV